MSDTFLTKEEVAELTGRQTKTKQIEQPRKMGLPFWVNVIGRPVVARTAIEGPPAHAPTPNEPWVPNVLKKKI
jgi:hypothetical protein